MQHDNNLSIASALQQPDFIHRLKLLAIALIASSVLYLVAANWLMLLDLVKIFIPQILLLGVATLSIKVVSDSVRQALHAVCGLMMGLSLATLGQVYQTGADSYQLFLLWSLLLLPWLYRYNIAIYLQFCIISQLALMLFAVQTYYISTHENLFIFLILLLSGLQIFFALKFYPILRYIFVIWFSLISIYAALVLVDKHHDSLMLWCAFLVPNIIMLIYFYKKHDQVCSIMVATGELLAILIYVLGSIFPKLSEIQALFFAAVLIFSLFAALAYLVTQIFKGSRFYVIPLGIGAWLSSLFFALLILVAWAEVSLIASIPFMIVGLIALRKPQLFIQQFGYSLFIAGQIAFLVHFGFETKLVYVVLFAQVMILFVLWMVLEKLNWLFALLQFIIIYILINAVFLFDFSFIDRQGIDIVFLIMLLNYVFLSGIFLLKSIRFKHYYRSIALFTLILIVTDFFFHWFYVLYLPNGQYTNQFYVFYYGLPILWLIVFTWMYLYQKVNHIVLVAILVLAGILIALGYFKLFIVLMLLAWSWTNQDRLVYICAMFVFGLLLWYLYYSLYIPFLLKSLMIFLSGCAVWGLVYLLNQSIQFLEHKA